MITVEIAQAGLEKVLAFATAKHAGQVRKKNQEPYINHPKRVEVIAQQINIERGTEANPIAISCTSWLHDVVEDCHVSPQEVYELVRDSFHDMFLASAVSLAVARLTRVKKETEILPYLTAIKGQNLALIVKLADLRDNMSDLEPSNLLDKYRLCEHFLLN